MRVSPDYSQNIELRLRQVRDLPALPQLVNEIIAELDRPETPASHIANLVSYDPGLTSKFLRMVNSAAYGFQRQISSVQHAIMILGFGQVRGIVLSASILKLFQGQEAQGLKADAFWRHSFGTALASRTLAEHLKVPYAEDAFSAGMLHDLGKLIWAAYFSADYLTVLTEAKAQRLLLHGEPFRALEESLLGLDHAALGYHLAIRWKLPLTFAQAIRYHHAPYQAEDARELVHVVALANLFVILNQDLGGVFSVNAMPEWVWTGFGLNPEQDEPLLAEWFALTKTALETLDELIQSLGV